MQHCIPLLPEPAHVSDQLVIEFFLELRQCFLILLLLLLQLVPLILRLLDDRREVFLQTLLSLLKLKKSIINNSITSDLSGLTLPSIHYFGQIIKTYYKLRHLHPGYSMDNFFLTQGRGQILNLL